MRRSRTVATIALSLSALLWSAGGVHAQLATAKCTAAKIKCSNNKATGLLKCHNKAETKNLAVDQACLQKAEDKFDGGLDPAKGCMGKAEAKKQPCATTGDTTTIEAKVDAFVLDVVTDLDPGYPAPVLNKCSAGKKKCVSNKVKSLLGCYGKDATKPDVAALAACIQKAQDKFDGGADPAKGCFQKLEAKYPVSSATPCLTFADTAALEAKADAFALDVKTELSGPAAPTVLDFSVTAPGGGCGTSEDASSTTLKTLSCGGLNLGGGASIIPEGTTPDGSINRYALSCAGASCTIGPTSAAPPVNSSAPDCTDTGCNFGTPLPIANPAVPALSTCVMNTWSAAASGTIDLSTGVSSTNVPLVSDVYTTGNATQPCPRCSATGTPASPGTGTCDRGPRATMACTTTNSSGYTRDCPTGGVGSVGTPCPGGPGGGGCAANSCPCNVGGGNCCDGSHVGMINVNLSPLTTGISTVNDAGGLFCPSQSHAGCFGSAACRTITENGSPAGPLVSGSPSAVTIASVFCVQATGNGLVDATTDLPGPGAVSLPGAYLTHD